MERIGGGMHEKAKRDTGLEYDGMGEVMCGYYITCSFPCVCGETGIQRRCDLKEKDLKKRQGLGGTGR